MQSYTCARISIEIYLKITNKNHLINKAEIITRYHIFIKNDRDTLKSKFRKQ